MRLSNRLVDCMREIQASEAKTHLPQLLDEGPSGGDADHHAPWTPHSRESCPNRSAPGGNRQAPGPSESSKANRRNHHGRVVCRPAMRDGSPDGFVLDASLRACGRSTMKTTRPPARLSSECKPKRRRAPACGGSKCGISYRENERRRRIGDPDHRVFSNTSRCSPAGGPRSPDENAVLGWHAPSRCLLPMPPIGIGSARGPCPLATLDGDLRKAAAGRRGGPCHPRQ